jgi:hypothetical protein
VAELDERARHARGPEEPHLFAPTTRCQKPPK